MKSILSKDFRYTSSAQTDVRKTIAREKKRLAEQAKSDKAEVELKVRKIGAEHGR